ncbi:MAG: GNAT family N-acetyltransferase [Anaerolineae bacterium]|nr:GNAT family N-acetyltransferase [Anaerolineae bacterium]
MQVRVTRIREKHVEELEAMQRLVFPTLTQDELFTAQKYRKHVELFPEGQFVALAMVEGREKVIGAASAFRTTFDFDYIHHTFQEAVADGWLTNHNPKGDWLYGADMSVHPDFRRRGIGSLLYKARRKLVHQLNLRGEIAGGMLPGYERYKKHMTIEQYVMNVIMGRATGKTLAMQLKNGFKVRGILYDHITDPRANNCATLLVRDNPHYIPDYIKAGV